MHVRVASEAVAGRLAAALLAGCVIAAGCGGDTRGITVTWTIEPTPPAAGAATVVRVTLAEPDGRPADGATLTLEAHMTHPGMAPVRGRLTARGGGTYEGRVNLSMPGDWIFVVAGHLADGRRITKEIQVPSVRPAG